MRFWRRFADVSGKIVLAVDKSSIRLPKTDCKCQESTTKCHVLLFYFRFLYCFYFVSPHWETDQKQLTFIKQIFCFWTRAELQNEMHLKNDAQFYFITFLFFFFFRAGGTDWNEFFSRLSKYKLTINWQIMHINFLTFLLPLKLPSPCCFFFLYFFLSVFLSKNSTALSDQFTVEVSFFLYA